MQKVAFLQRIVSIFWGAIALSMVNTWYSLFSQYFTECLPGTQLVSFENMHKNVKLNMKILSNITSKRRSTRSTSFSSPSSFFIVPWASHSVSSASHWLSSLVCYTRGKPRPPKGPRSSSFLKKWKNGFLKSWKAQKTWI